MSESIASGSRHSARLGEHWRMSPSFWLALATFFCRQYDFTSAFVTWQGSHMDNLRVGPAIRRIVLLRPRPSGGLEPTILYKDQRKKKKQTRGLQPVEEVARRLTKAQRAFWDSMAEGHGRSNEKKRDGWARDGVTNLAKASRKSAKQLTKMF
jgi:Family of unknown function (DUF6312)